MYAHAGEEQDESHFAQHEVGGGGSVGVDFITVTEGSDEDGHNERTACQTELHGYLNTGNGDGNLSDDDTYHDTEEDGTHIGVVEFLGRCSDNILHMFDVLLSTCNKDAVAHLETQVAVGEQLNAVTNDASNVNAIHRGEVKLAKGFTVDFGLCDDQSTRHVFLQVHVRLPVLGQRFTHEHGDGFCLVFGTNQVQFHA